MSNIRYMTVNQIVDSDSYPFTKASMRYLLINRDKNGLEKCVRKIGDKLLIREDLFVEWMESHASKEEETS